MPTYDLHPFEDRRLTVVLTVTPDRVLRRLHKGEQIAIEKVAGGWKEIPMPNPVPINRIGGSKDLRLP